MAWSLVACACGAGDDEAAPPDPATTPIDGVHGRVSPAVGGVPAVVLLEPVGAAAAYGGGPPKIDQFGLQFSPRFVVAHLGQPVIFTNSESIAHNVIVRAASGGETLLNADTHPGDSVLLSLQEPGGYDVTCEVHPGMTAFVYATEAPYAAFAEPDGTFAIGGVPAGEYTLRVWSVDRPAGVERTIRVTDGAATRVDLAPPG